MLKVNYWLLFIFVSCFTICINSTLLAANLVINGKPEATIVIPDKAPDCVKRAAWELQYHVKKASGAELSIVQESKLIPTGKQQALIYLGDCRSTADIGLEGSKLKRNESVIKVANNHIYITGRDEYINWLRNDGSIGTLLGVYEVLNSYMGVRWLWPGESGEIIPENRNISIPDMNKTLALPLKFALWRTLSDYSKNSWTSEKNYKNFIEAQNIWLRRHRFNQDASLQFYPHGFTSYWERFNKTNPSFFNLLPDGSRRPDPLTFNGRPDLISMCVSDSNLHKQIVQEWLCAHTERAPLININENDTAGKCVCDKCLSWDDSPVPAAVRREKASIRFAKNDPQWYEELGSVSNRYAHFAKAVMEEADKSAPQEKAKLAGLVYANYSMAPSKDIKFNQRIVERYCPPLMFPWTESKVQEYKQSWLGWSACGADMIMRPNFTLSGHCFPIFYANKFADCFRLAAEHNLIGLDMDSLKGDFAAEPLNYYMIARLQQNFDISQEQVLNEFYNAFGPVAKEIKEYFEYLENISNNYTAIDGEKTIEGGNHATFYAIADKLFTQKVFAASRTILDRAAQAAAGNNALLKRINFLQIGLKNAELTAKTQIAFKKYKSSGNIDEFANALEILDKFRAEHEATLFANIGVLQAWENRSWPREMIRLSNKNMQSLPLQWNFMWDPEKKGEQEFWFARDLDDSKWLKIDVDQVWEKQPVGIEWQKQHNRAYDGEAWYRLAFKAPKLRNEDKLVLLFGAVDEACQVWVNGKKMLDRPYPFNGNANSWQEAFEIDITDVVEFDKSNLIAVKVIDKFGAGGIWKPVYLKIVPKPLSQAENIIKNSSFEQGESSWNKNVPMGKVQFIVDKANFHSGQASGTIKVVSIDSTKKYAGKYGTWARWLQPLNKLEPGKKYQLQVWVFTSMDFDGILDIWIRSGIKTTLSKANINLSWLATGGKWQMLSMEFVPEKNDGTIYLNMMANCGSVSFDDIIICAEK